MTDRTRENLELLAMAVGSFVATVALSGLAHLANYLMLHLEVGEYDRGTNIGAFVAIGVVVIWKTFTKIHNSRFEHWKLIREESEDYS